MYNNGKIGLKISIGICDDTFLKPKLETGAE